MSKGSIWCLFSIQNEYDQPSNNLVAWWKKKPDFKALAKALNIDFKGDDSILIVVNIHQDGERRVGNCDYRLDEVPEGILKDKE